MEEGLSLLIDLINWRSFSSLQKLTSVTVAVFVVSWLISQWTLFLVFAVSLAGGVQLSNKLLLHDKASLFAEMLFYKLETAYLKLESVYRDTKHLMFGSNISPMLAPTVINELSMLYDDEADRYGAVAPTSAATTSLQLEMNSIQLLIIRDFIRSWYADFSYDAQFLKEAKGLLQHVFNNLVCHLSNQNPKVIIAKVIQLYAHQLTLFQKAKSTYQSHQIHPKTKVPLESKVKRHCSIDEAFEKTNALHVAVVADSEELNYLRGIVSLFVLSLCPSAFVKGMCSRTVIIEILTNSVMLAIMQMASDPDWLMEVIIILTSEEELNSVDTSSSKDLEPCKNSAVMSEEKRDNDEDKGLLQVDILNDSGTNKLSTEELVKKVCMDTEGGLKETPPNYEDIEGPMKQALTYAAQYCEVENVHSMTKPRESVLNSNHQDQLAKNESFDESMDLLDKINSSEKQNSTLMHSKESVNTHEAQREDKSCCDTFENIITKQESDIEEKIPEGVTPVPLDFQLDPQKILSFGRRISTASADSDTSTESSSSLSKFSSFKNFFVDTLKPSAKQQTLKKPKSLALFSEKSNSLQSNLATSKQKGSRDADEEKRDEKSVVPPQLQVDGVPVNTEKPKTNSFSFFSSLASLSPLENQTSGSSQHSDLTPSPGFFSSVKPFFGFSRSQSDIQSHSEGEISESPLPTPSPSEFHIDYDSFTVLENATEDQSAVLRHKDLSKSLSLDDRMIIQDVTISKTAVCNEFRSTTQYCLYIIEYEALYFTDEGNAVLRSGLVKRRHREFTNLQSRLEAYPAYKKHMKHIRGPKRWPTLPFKSLDKGTVESRRLFLEKYLKDLIQVEAICNGPDLREFLAYEGDSHIAFVKKSPDITVPRLDKMLMRGVSEVVDRLKALPNIPQEMMSGFRVGRDLLEEKATRGRNEWDVDSIDLNIGIDLEHANVTSRGSFLPMMANQVVDELSRIGVHENDLDQVSDVISDHKCQVVEAYQQEVDKVLASLPRVQGDGAECPDEQASSVGSPGELQLNTAIFDLLAQCLQGRDHWICKDRVMRPLQSVLGKALDRYLESSIDSLTSDVQLTLYLRLLREKIWPHGQLWSDSQLPRTDDERAITRQKAKESLINFFPEAVKVVIGKQDFEEVIDVFLSSLHSERLNRHLLYQILDMLMEQLFPEVTGQSFLFDLLFAKTAPSH